jgi:serine/threonine protein phosphatase 1
MLRPLEALLEAVLKRDLGARYIFVGDYVNRGPQTPGVIDRLLGLQNATFLRGNHDDIFDLIVNGQCYLGQNDPSDALAAYRSFMNHGLADTLGAYGADWTQLEFLLRHPDLQRLRQLTQLVPAEHRKFFRGLRAVVEYDTFFVAHAYWDPAESDTSPDIAARLVSDAKLRSQLLWGRYNEAQIQSKKRWKRTGYFGHTPVSNYLKGADVKPVRGSQIVLLDTGAALGANGRLSAVCADNGELIQADRAGAIV